MGMKLITGGVVMIYRSINISAADATKERFKGLMKENVLVHHISFEMLNDSE
ncbi:hypothetical protein [Metabacillus sp. Hm71]|uniref:hypothetical protein n=1 Tax=Metabacillus sp. Hm71 TaxID=3450743 RepID=UPI003F444955